MARPREFDTDEVLEDIIEVFWAQGYDGTSFSDLERATGLKKGSLFAAYGDKQTLFALALERYQTDKCQSFACLCAENCSPRKILTAWLLAAAGLSEKKSSRRGCFAINAHIQMASRDKKCARLLAKHREKMESMLCELIRRGIEASEFRRSLKANSAACYLLCVAAGMQTLSRAPEGCCRSAKDLEGIVELAMRGLQ